jgi:hypothetical protein
MSVTIKHVTAGELSSKLAKDKTKYNALEVGHFMADSIDKQLRDSIEIYKPMIDENEFCVVMLIAKDPLIANVLRRKFFCWPYLPKPRPNQSVFLYNKGLDRITKRLWVLPSDCVMAELTSLDLVDPRYQTMKMWSDWFFHGWKIFPNNDPNSKDKHRWINTTPGYFFKKIREQHEISLLAEHEYISLHKEELIKAGCKMVDPGFTESFDFSKIAIKKVIDSVNPIIDKDGLDSLGKAENTDREISTHV